MKKVNIIMLIKMREIIKMKMIMIIIVSTIHNDDGNKFIVTSVNRALSSAVLTASLNLSSSLLRSSW